MQGWRKRQEDAQVAAISKGEKKDLNIFGVFDGHGGKEISKFVSNHFIDELIKNKNISTDISLALKETFIKMDEIMQTKEGIEEIKKYCQEALKEDEEQSKNETNPQMKLLESLILKKNPEADDIFMKTGCTACVMTIDETNKKIYFANAGDSRVVYCKNGKAEAGSTDHKPELESEKNRINKADGWISNGRVKGNLNLTRGFGDLEYKQNKNLKPEEQMITADPDIKIIDYSKDIDFVQKRLKDTPDIKISKIIEEMLDQIVAKDLYNETGLGCDNMTCIVIVFKK